MGAAERDLGEIGQSLKIGQIGAFGIVVELHQTIAGLHLGAGFEENLGDPPVDLGGDGNLMDGNHAADPIEIVGHRFADHRHRADRRRRRQVVGKELGDHLLAE